MSALTCASYPPHSPVLGGDTVAGEVQPIQTRRHRSQVRLRLIPSSRIAQPRGWTRNYHHVLVMLLRLRQICSHASLIQEKGVYFVPANELNQSPTDAFAELSRARQLVSPEFVAKMRDQFKEAALKRRVIASEAEVRPQPLSLFFAQSK